MKKSLHKYLLLFSFILLSNGKFYAQNKYIDTLAALLKTNIPDTFRVAILAELSDVCDDSQISDYANQGNALAIKLLSNPSLDEKSRRRLMKLHSLLLNNLGYVAGRKGDIKSSLDHYHKSLSLREKLNDPAGIATALSNIATVYQGQDNPEKALEYLLRSDEYWKKAKNRSQEIITLSGIATVYVYLKKDSLAFQFARKSLDLIKTEKDPEAEEVALHTMGQLYLNAHDTASAHKYFERSFVLADSLKDVRGIIDNLAALAKLKGIAGKNKEWMEMMKKVLKLSKENGLAEEIRDADKLLYEQMREDKNYQEALEYYTEYIIYRDSIQNHQNRKKLFQKELEHDFELKEASLELKRQKEKIEEEKEKQRGRTMMIIIGAVALSALVVAGVVFRSLSVTRRQKKTIEEQKDLVEEKQNEIISSINYAKRIQSAVLTGDEVWGRISKEHFIIFRPRDIVSGDFYWAHVLPNGRAVFALADCTGHGVPGGFMSMLGNSFLNELVVENKIFSAAAILNKLRDKVIKALDQQGGGDHKDGMDIALCVWNKMDNTLEFAGANNALYIVREGKLTELKGDKMPIGKFVKEETVFASQTVQLQKGDCLYLCTDGLPDQFGGPSAKKFKYRQLEELLVKVSTLSPQEQKEKIDREFINWKGRQEQVDDVSLVGLKV